MAADTPVAQAPGPDKPDTHIRGDEVGEETQEVQQDAQNARARRSRERALDRKHAKVPLSAEDERVVADFSRSERAAFRNLSEQDRAKFRKAYDYLYCEDRPGHETSTSKAAREGFRAALRRGALEVPDREGKTALDHFAARAGTDLGGGLDGKTYGLDARGQLENLARHLGHPQRIYQGTGTNDCVAASMQVQMARREPGEYIRVATGLIFDGEAKLYGPDGGSSTMKLDKRAIWKSDGKKVRETTSEIIQQSFMTYARANFPDRPEDKRVWSYGSKGRGLTMRQAEGLYENLTGNRAAAISVNDANRETASEAILDAARAGRRFQIGLGSNRGGHMVTLLGVSNDKHGNLVAKFSDSQTAGQRTMPWNEFKNLIDGAILPADFAEPFVGQKSASKDDHVGGTLADNSASLGSAPTAPAPPPPSRGRSRGSPGPLG